MVVVDETGMGAAVVVNAVEVTLLLAAALYRPGDVGTQQVSREQGRVSTARGCYSTTTACYLLVTHNSNRKSYSNSLAS
jgi:hypothetical protein